jgi:hypothetical protein
MEDKMISRILFLVCLALFLALPLDSSAFVSNIGQAATNSFCFEGDQNPLTADQQNDSAIPPCACLPSEAVGACGCSSSSGTPSRWGTSGCNDAVAAAKARGAAFTCY